MKTFNDYRAALIDVGPATKERMWRRWSSETTESC